jgi:thiamine-monophosphate kinase
MIVTVDNAGEFGLIARVIGRLGAPGQALLGPGDDAAVVAAPDGRVVATTDLLVEGGHFRRDWSTAYDIGRKAAAQNLADIAAMGAVPTAVLVGLGCPPDTALTWIDELTDGLRDEAGMVGAAVVGGDVVRSAAVLLAVTALGDLQGRDPVTRSGARPGDLVAVCGRLGWAAAGLAVLGRGFRSPGRVVAAHRRPEPPYGEGPRAASAGATAMIDVSDGLVQDLGHIAAASAVSMDLRSAALEVPQPLVDVGAALGVDPCQWLLAGGDDHALAATFGAAVPDGWVAVGTVGPGDGVTVDGEPFAGGHDHFG